MGWQKRSSGKRYDSHSGHASPIGVHTRKPIWLEVLSTFCRICVSDPCNDIGHDCAKNFTGSSGSMEPSALLLMTHELLDKCCCPFGCIVADDDSSIRAQMKRKNKHWMIENNAAEPPKVWSNISKKMVPRPDHGQLHCPHPEPIFLGDPAHRKKTCGKELWALACANQDVSKGVSKLDALKLTKNCGHMI